jgi:hypothetical protein
MKITGELSKAELNIGGNGVGFDPQLQELNFEDILNLILAEENIQRKSSEIPFNSIIPSEGSLEVQGQPTANKEEKDNDFLINLSIFGLFAYGQINRALEEKKVRADNALAKTDIDLPTEKKISISLVLFKSLEDKPQNTFAQPFTEANKEGKSVNDEFLADFIVKPVEGKNAQVSNLFNVGEEYTQVGILDIKINTAWFFC